MKFTIKEKLMLWFKYNTRINIIISSLLVFLGSGLSLLHFKLTLTTLEVILFIIIIKICIAIFIAGLISALIPFYIQPKLYKKIITKWVCDGNTKKQAIGKLNNYIILTYREEYNSKKRRNKMCREIEEVEHNIRFSNFKPTMRK